MDVGSGTFTERNFDEAVAATRAALTGRGFDIPHAVDLTALVRDRAGGDVERVRILGACAPGFAAAAYAVNEDVALLLPGNVVVRESGGGCVIEAQNRHCCPRWSPEGCRTSRTTCPPTCAR